MRKSIFIIAALFAATFANAQITLEGVIAGRFPTWIYVDEYYFDCGKLPVIYGDTLVELYNTDGTLYKTIRFAPSTQNNVINNANRAPSAVMGGPSSGCYLFSRNIFTTDGKVAFVRWANNHLSVYDEDGTLVSDLQDSDSNFGIFPVDGFWKLIIQEDKWDSETYTSSYTLYIYSLPGNGETQAVSTPSSPKRNARKYLNNDQVLIESNERTYNMQGQQVK